MANGNGQSGPNGARRKGSKRRVSEKMRQANRRNARRPRIRRTDDEKAVLRAMALSAIDFLKGPALKRMMEIVLTGNAADATRAFSTIADRFGLPVQSEQTLRAEAMGVPMLVFRRIGFPPPGQTESTQAVAVAVQQ